MLLNINTYFIINTSKIFDLSLYILFSKYINNFLNLTVTLYTIKQNMIGCSQTKCLTAIILIKLIKTFNNLRHCYVIKYRFY